MAFFKFPTKIDAAKEYSFDDIPLFSALSPAEQKIILKKARLVEYKRGDMVYKEGTPSEAFYVVISGRFRLYNELRGNDSGNTLFYACRGDHFGETSLFTGRNHSASVEAKRDGLILKLEKEDFLKLIREIPAISLYLNRSLGHRLSKSEEENGRQREVKVCALYSNCDPEQSLTFWFDLAARLACDTSKRIIVVDFLSAVLPYAQEELKKSPIPSFNLSAMEPTSETDLRGCVLQHTSKFYYLHVPANLAEQDGEKKIPSLITYLTHRYDYLMLRLEKDMGHATFLSLKKTDDVYVLCAPDSEKIAACSKVLEEFQKTYAFSANEIKVVIPESKDSKLVYEEQERLLGARVFSMLPNRSQEDRYAASIRFLSREFSGKLIGLALGSGAAYGLAHIGVMRVFERENIPVDVISGSSIGALIGAFWASGFKSQEMLDMAQSITVKNAFFKLIGFRDLSIAHRGFIKGNRIIKFLQSYLGDGTFQDLKIPLKIAATNLFGSEEIVFEGGKLMDALRASISIPGIFRPFHYRGQILIDGGVIDPLPVRILAKMGVKKIIAVNVLTSAKQRLEAARLKSKVTYSHLRSMASKNPISKGFEGSMYRLNRRYSDNIFNVIMNTIQFMEYELADAASNEADVVIHPEVAEGHWAQFYSPMKFIKAGEEKTLELLSEIKQLIAE